MRRTVGPYGKSFRCPVSELSGMWRRGLQHQPRYSFISWRSTSGVSAFHWALPLWKVAHTTE
eukprot:4588328-Amphidinium_carterae.1